VSCAGGRMEAHDVGGDTGRANLAPRAFEGWGVIEVDGRGEGGEACRLVVFKQAFVRLL